MATNDTASSGNTDQGSKNTEQGADTGNKRSLSQLLDEYDKGSGADGKKEPPPDEGLKRKVDALEAEAAERSYQSGIEGVIKTLKGDLEVDDFIVESWANKQAADDPRLQKLWEERASRKKEFNEAIEALKPEFQKYAQEKILGKESSGGNNNSLVAAVRNARDSDPGGGEMDDVKWGGLSDSDFALKKAEVFRLAKAGELK